MSALSDLAVKIAASQVGKKEDPPGSNTGKEVSTYLASVDIFYGASWCAAFVYWVFLQASKELGIKTPLFKTAGALNTWHKNKEHQQKYPQPGDIFVMDHGGGFGHVGLIASIDADGLLHTIEGNSNNNGSRDGGAVVLHTRKRDERMMKGFVRF